MTTNYYSHVSKWLDNFECDFVNYETDAGYASKLTSLLAVLTTYLLIN